ncbi:mnt isoform X2 [Haematobia irritans]|uniref:mnt isoform X2 n=1 Tax=Haematobia irritans TaxID=7368 RepID=UPI003F507677
MWQPPNVNKSLHPELYATLLTPTVAPPIRLSEEMSPGSFMNLTKSHVNDLIVKPQSPLSIANSTMTTATSNSSTPSAVAATAAAATAAAMYYNANNVLLQNSPLSLMAQLQQYLRLQQARTSSKTSAISSTWPTAGLSANGANTMAASVPSNERHSHLLLSSPEIAAAVSTGLMSPTRPSPPSTILPFRCADPMPALINSPSSSLTTASSNNTVMDLLPLDILADTFIRLNALHLSQHTTVTQSSLRPAAIPNIPHNSSSVAAAIKPYGPSQPLNVGSTVDANAAVAAAAMLSLATPSLPLSTVATSLTALPPPPPPPPLPPAAAATIPSLVHGLPLFKPHFYMDTQHNLSKMSTLKSSPNLTASEVTAQKSFDDIHHYPSKSSLTGLNPLHSKHSLLRGTLSLPPTTTSTVLSTDCDLKRRSLRKRTDDFLHKQRSRGIESSSLQHHRAVKNVADLNDEDEDDDLLLPPPKKKWIRHYLNANHPMHVQNPNGNNTSGSNSSSSMMVDDIPPTQQQQHTGGYSTSSNSQHSPPRQGGGNHYMHMMNAASSQQAGSAGGNPHVSHVTPRRRTISSTSNGAGTREVHNKLEKNRRAHLKECYEALKNQLSLKDEDRRKTSNLAILGEALRCVQSYQKQNQELEAKWEHLANDKINLQKRIVSLKRELGPKYEQIFSGIFPDIEIGSIPSERDTINDVHSLSSGRGSTLYSSSSSLSSGGSNGSNSNGSSNAMSSPVGAGLQTAMPTAISPVITKINNNNNSSNNSSTTSPISISNNNNFILQHQRKHPTTTTTISTTIQAVAIPTQVVAGLGGGNHIGVAGGANSPTSGSPNTLVTFGGGGGGNTMPLSLTAKNISATAITRGSPTPSTPSPSPSSSSGVSSSSSLISSSPPINGVISNGRNVTVNIPNGLKLQAAAVNGVTGSVIGNGATSAAATIIATSAPAQGVNNTNNAAVLTNSQTQLNGGRKKTLSLSNNTNTLHGTSNAMAKLQQYNHRQQTPHHKQTLNHQHHHHQQQLSAEDGEQPAKFLKVLNDKGATTNIAGGGGVGCVGGIISSGLHEGIATNFLNGNGQKMIISNNFVEEEEEEQEAGDNTTKGKTSITNGSVPVATSILSASELCRLPGGAELNILSSTPTNGIKTGSGSTTLATAFYHANGKITLVNGLPPSTTGHVTSSADNALVPSSTVGSKGTTVSNGLMLKDAPNSSTLLIANGTSELNTSPATNINGLHFRGNFAQLLAAANSTSNNNLQQVASNNGTVASSKNYGFHMATTSNLANLSAVDASKTKISPKQTIVAWRPGATTTN